MNMTGGGNSAQNLGLKTVRAAFARVKFRAAIRELDDDIGAVFRGGFQNGIDGVCPRDVDSGEGISSVLTGFDEGQVIVAADNAGLQGVLSHDEILLTEPDYISIV